MVKHEYNPICDIQYFLSPTLPENALRSFSEQSTSQQQFASQEYFVKSQVQKYLSYWKAVWLNIGGVVSPSFCWLGLLNFDVDFPFDPLGPSGRVKMLASSYEGVSLFSSFCGGDETGRSVGRETMQLLRLTKVGIQNLC